jgi:sulfoxide reductase catalytic subunit YedY
VPIKVGSAALAACKPGAAADALVDLNGDLYPAPRNEAYQLDRPITAEALASTYNNFYEFGSHKRISKAAQRLKIRPWEISIDGLVEKPFSLDFDDLIRKVSLEERHYRLRCVEAWSMDVPWTGFPLKALIDLAKPLSSAKYLRMETFMDRKQAPGFKQSWYPWPYVEGLTMAEAVHDLAFIVTGVYGKPLPKQHGAPLRLAVPWKYGFKSIKSIVKFSFTDKEPVSFWQKVNGREYGFFANVNPAKSHARWSQATEEVLGTGKRVPTRLFNGYAEEIGDLYAGIEGRNIFY